MKRWLLLLIALMVIGVGSGTGWLWWQLQPIDPGNNHPQTFTVRSGTSVTSIARQLYDQGYIRHPLVFRAAVVAQQLTTKLQAGNFTLQKGMSVLEITQALTKADNDVWVTLKEGWRAEEMGEALAAVVPEFSPNDPAFAAECLQHNGRLFPETYKIPLHYTTAQTCQLLRAEYEKRVVPLRPLLAQRGVREQDALIIASLVEREARSPENMRRVASVLWNRMELGMPLQVDATLQYIRGYDETEKTWWPTPLAADKERMSPFNTYQHTGLPPAPIANPGLNALRAAFDPADTDYLYYISNRTGTELHFATTYEEHQTNIAKYLR